MCSEFIEPHYVTIKNNLVKFNGVNFMVYIVSLSYSLDI